VPVSHIAVLRREALGILLGLYGRVNHETLRETWSPPPFPPLIVIGRSYPELASFCNPYSVMSFSHGQSGHLSGYDLMIWRCVTVREVTAVRLDFLRPVRAGSFELPVSLPESNVIGQKERDRPIVLSTTLQDGN
jgi:hypothetical protein